MCEYNSEVKPHSPIHKGVFLIVLLSFDVFTKKAAQYFLSSLPNSKLTIGNLIQLVLRYNIIGIDGVYSADKGKAIITFRLPAFNLAIFFILLFFFNSNMKERVKRELCIASLIIAVFFAITFRDSFRSFEVPFFLNSVLRKLPMLLWLGLLYIKATSTFASIIVIFILGGALGNTLSLFYPPFVPVDFIHINLNPLWGGTVNFSDFYILVGILLLAIYIPWASYRAIRQYIRKMKEGHGHSPHP